MYIYIYILFLFFSLRYFTRARDIPDPILFFFISATFYPSTLLIFPYALCTFHVRYKIFLILLLFFFYTCIFILYRHEEKDTIGIIWKNNDSPTLFSHFCLWLSTGIPRTPETEQIPNAQLQMRQKSWIFWRSSWESCD